MTIRGLGPVVLLGLLASLASSSASGGAPLALGGDPRVDPTDFDVTVFASGLPYPMAALQLQDGSLLLASNPGGSLFSAPHELVRLVDVDADGVADGLGNVLYTGLPGPVFSLHLAGDLVIAATGSTILLLRQGATPAQPLTQVGRLDLAYAAGWWHNSTSVVGLRRALQQPGRWEVFFNIGSQFNDTASTATVIASGMINASLQPGSVWRLTLDDTGAAPSAVSLAQIASGLRNAFSGGLDPSTGDLYLAENGIDTPGNLAEPLSADELDVVASASIGGSIESFGFPDTYVRYRTGVQVGNSGLLPGVAFQPLPPPDGSEAEGASAFAFAPFRFPAGLERGAFVGFHGQSEGTGLANEENPVAFVDLTNGTYFHFISNDEPAFGHADTLLATADALFVLDVASNGALSGPASGVIYRIGVANSCSAQGGDADRDGVCDSAGPACSCRPLLLPGCIQNCTDSCPRRVNPEQLDRGRPAIGGADSSLPDGTGDACTCGDLDADGDVDGADVDAYRRKLTGGPAPFSKDLCNLDPSGTAVCDLRDVTRLRRLLAGRSGGIANLSACAAMAGF